MNATAEQLKERTIAFTSVAANYRAGCRARSRKDFIAKLGLVIEEAEESVFWLKFTIASGMNAVGSVELLVEAHELLAIFTASAKTATANYAASHQISN